LADYPAILELCYWVAALLRYSERHKTTTVSRFFSQSTEVSPKDKFLPKRNTSVNNQRNVPKVKLNKQQQAT